MMISMSIVIERTGLRPTAMRDNFVGVCARSVLVGRLGRRVKDVESDDKFSSSGRSKQTGPGGCRLLEMDLPVVVVAVVAVVALLPLRYSRHVDYITDVLVGLSRRRRRLPPPRFLQYIFFFSSF